MACFGDTYHRRSRPDRTRGEWIYYCVDTPSVFRELHLPSSWDDMTPSQRKAYDALYDLARDHGTNVYRSAVRRG